MDDNTTSSGAINRNQGVALIAAIAAAALVAAVLFIAGGNDDKGDPKVLGSTVTRPTIADGPATTVTPEITANTAPATTAPTATVPTDIDSDGSNGSGSTGNGSTPATTRVRTPATTRVVTASSVVPAQTLPRVPSGDTNEVSDNTVAFTVSNGQISNVVSSNRQGAGNLSYDVSVTSATRATATTSNVKFAIAFTNNTGNTITAPDKKIGAMIAEGDGIQMTAVPFSGTLQPSYQNSEKSTASAGFSLNLPNGTYTFSSSALIRFA